MVLYKLYLCAFFAVALQMVAVNANESHIVEILERDARTAKEKMEIMKYLLRNKMTHTQNRYHNNMDKVIADTEMRVKSMRCGEITMNRVKTARQYGWGSFKQCVELTRAFADGELVIYDTTVCLEDVFHLLANVSKIVAECRHLSLFKAISCVIETIANHSDEYQQKSEAVLTLLSRMDNITHHIYQTFYNCINKTEALVSAYVDDIILENCDNSSLFKSFVGSIESKLNNNKKLTLFNTAIEENPREAPTEEHHQKTLLDNHLQKQLSEERQQKTVAEKSKN